MEFQITSTIECHAATETELKELILTINNFVESKSGSVEHLIRTSTG